MVSLVVVVLDKASDLLFHLPGEVVLLQVDHVLHRAVIPFDLPLCRRMECLPSAMSHPFLQEILGKLHGDIARSVVREEPRPVVYRGVFHPGLPDRLFQQVFHISGLHRRVELPGDDIPGEVIENARQEIPPPTNDLHIGEIRLPELVHPGGGIGELVRGTDHHIGWTGDQVEGLQNPVNA